MNKKKYSFGVFDIVVIFILLAVIILPFAVKIAASDDTKYIEYKIKTEDAERFDTGNAVIVNNSCVGYILKVEGGILTVGAYADEKPDGYYVSGVPVHIGADMTFYAGNEASSGMCVGLVRAVVSLTDVIDN